MKQPKTWGNIALRKKALKLLNDSNAIDDGPVRLARVLKSIGFSYVEFTPDIESQQILGAVIPADNQIFINGDESDECQHYTLAHEIGHAVLHPNESVVEFRVFNPVNHTPEEKIKERAANVFAHELILPIEKFIEKFIELDGDIKEMASYFLVDQSKVENRLHFLKKQIKTNRLDNFLAD